MLKISGLKYEKRKYWLYSKIYLQVWAHLGNNSLTIYQSKNVPKERRREKRNTCIFSKTLSRNVLVLEITTERIRSWNLSGSKSIELKYLHYIFRTFLPCCSIINLVDIWLQALNWELIVWKDWTVSNRSVCSPSAPRRHIIRLRSKL
jgi:hypothetical protein